MRRVKKLLLIGWDGADWKIISRLMEAGQMPAFERLVNDGCIGNIATLNPCLSPILWSSIATGKRPQKHRVLGFVEADPYTGVVRPVSSRTRKCKALWNILTQSGFRTHVVGWWPSHPAEPIDGVCVSNLFQQAKAPLGQPWPMLPGTVFPEQLAAPLADLRVHPGELTAEQLLPFIPGAAEIDQDKDPRLAILAKIIAECSSIHAAATEIMATEPWDFMAVYYDAIDHLSHTFMHFYPPRMEGVEESLFDMYKDVVAGGYRFHDMMLARLVQLAGPETTILLLSDHGFHSDHLRPRGLPKTPGAPAIQHREYGVFCASGPGIRQDERIYGASLLDVAPTVLTLLGLPVGEDMDGRPLLQLLTDPPPPTFVNSWETIAGNAGMHPPTNDVEPWQALEAVKQLVALGYLEPLDPNREKAIAATIREEKFNLAQSYLSARDAQAAAPILAELARDYPREPRFILLQAKCLYELREMAGAKVAVAKVLEIAPDHPAALHLLGGIAIEEGRMAEGLQLYRKAEACEPRLPTLHVQIGNAYLKMSAWQDAARAFIHALEIDGDSAQAYHGMAQTSIGMGDFTAGADMALRAVGLLHHLPLAHFHLGVCLAHLGQPERAIQAFETCLDMRPNTPAAHGWLSQIYDRTKHDKAKADQHRVLAKTV